MELLAFDCPRCGQPAQHRFYGPCPRCHEELRDRVRGEARAINVAAYEPKMNVVPNQVATKE